MTDTVAIFDPKAVRAHRARAARLPADGRFLERAARERLVDRLDEVRRRFPLVLDLGSGDGDLAQMLAAGGHAADIISFDAVPGFAVRGVRSVVGDAEALPFAASSIDLAIANLVLHWTNDLPGALWQLARILKPDGLLLATLWGGETLAELRESLMQADLEISSGAGPRVSPFTDVRDAGALLQRAGFALPVVDSELLTVTYPDMFALIRDLRAMGETNAVKLRRMGFTSRAIMLRAAEIYAKRFAEPGGRIRASFQLLTLTGWAPHASQPKPLRPGSAAHSLAEALKSGLPKA
ncbi:MAG TPA: methyltransferase domain-containing protein [Stellaceae bacterium]|nr:methyltransferase domain-containing protein [Stellaceae bacterium]